MSIKNIIKFIKLMAEIVTSINNNQYIYCLSCKWSSRRTWETNSNWNGPFSGLIAKEKRIWNSWKTNLWWFLSETNQANHNGVWPSTQYDTFYDMFSIPLWSQSVYSERRTLANHVLETCLKWPQGSKFFFHGPPGRCPWSSSTSIFQQSFHSQNEW